MSVDGLSFLLLDSFKAWNSVQMKSKFMIDIGFRSTLIGNGFLMSEILEREEKKQTIIQSISRDGLSVLQYFD